MTTKENTQTMRKIRSEISKKRKKEKQNRQERNKQKMQQKKLKQQRENLRRNLQIQKSRTCKNIYQL